LVFPFFVSPGMRVIAVVILALAQFNFCLAQRDLGVRPDESGGPLIYEQAAYDVKSYDITIEVIPEEKKIIASSLITAKIVQPIDWFVVDLKDNFIISEIKEGNRQLNFERRAGKLWIKLPMTKQPNDTVAIKISYSGEPRVAPRPPWVGGFVWNKTADGSDWIGVACQADGADLWLPVKDHPSDKPESVALHVTVPKGLYVASIGKLKKLEEIKDNKLIFHWYMSNPINNYNITLNIAPYKIIEDEYKSVDGSRFPVIFYALPEHYEKAKDIVLQAKKFLAFYEKYLGPYPFRSEKLGIVETPYLGMEHSTIIAYGNDFKNNEYGFDWLLLHELGHEWWGNLVTNADWKDFWLHEGFQSFMDTLYVEEIAGSEAYFKHMLSRMKQIRNKQPVAPIASSFSYQVYMAAPDYLKSDGDIYNKGAYILHTLRYLIGDVAFFKALRKMAYPTPAMEKLKNGYQVRFATTDDFIRIAEQESNMKLDWFFRVYLRQPALPKLVVRKIDGKTELSWETPDNFEFPMPVEIELNGKLMRIEMHRGKALIESSASDLKIDPRGWILKTVDFKTQY